MSAPGQEPNIVVLSIFTEQRKAEASKIRTKYPDRIPVGELFTLSFCFHLNIAEMRANKMCTRTLNVKAPAHFGSVVLFCLILQVVVEKAPNSQIVDIDKRKFLVPNDISVAQFMWIIRKRIQLSSEKAIFLFVGKVLPQSRYWLHEIILS